MAGDERGIRDGIDGVGYSLSTAIAKLKFLDDITGRATRRAWTGQRTDRAKLRPV